MSEGQRDELLTIKELQKELKIGRNRAYDLAYDIGITWVGHQIRIKRSTLEKWLIEQEQVDE